MLTCVTQASNVHQDHGPDFTRDSGQTHASPHVMPFRAFHVTHRVLAMIIPIVQTSSCILSPYRPKRLQSLLLMAALLVPQYDITALGAALCRHGQVISMMNCYTGERYAYANLLVKRLLQHGVRIQFIWYDINCKWKVAFKRFVSTLPPEQQQLVSSTQYPVPPWHLFAHRCRRPPPPPPPPPGGRNQGQQLFMTICKSPLVADVLDYVACHFQDMDWSEWLKHLSFQVSACTLISVHAAHLYSCHGSDKGPSHRCIL